MATIHCHFAMHIQTGPGIKGKFHTHSCVEIIFYNSGTGYLLANGKSMPYRKGMFSIYQPGAAHADNAAENGVQFCIGVSGCDSDLLPPGMWEADSGARSAFKRMIRSSGRADPLELDVLAGLVLLEIRRQLTTSHSMESMGFSDRAAQARHLMEEHFQEPIDLESIARQVFVGKEYLRQLFREKYGESPIRFLIRKRIELACYLLASTDQPIQEIARMAGIRNTFYFSRLFKKRMGVSPLEYRRKRDISFHPIEIPWKT